MAGWARNGDPASNLSTINDQWTNKMPHRHIPSERFFDALYLVERARSLVQSRIGACNGLVDASVRQQRMERWRTQPPFDREMAFRKMLRTIGLSQDQFERLLGETPGALSSRFLEPPEWINEIVRIYSNWERAEGKKTREIVESFGLLGVARPLVEDGLKRLQTRMESLAKSHRVLPFDPSSVTPLFVPSLKASLSRIALRTLVLELNVARLEGRLSGDTGEERHRLFAQILGE